MSPLEQVLGCARQIRCSGGTVGRVLCGPDAFAALAQEMGFQSDSETVVTLFGIPVERIPDIHGRSCLYLVPADRA